MSISTQDFDYVRAFLCDTAGIVIDKGKEYLVDSRLSMLAARTKHLTFDALLRALRAADPEVRRLAIEAMTTNETTFFRDVGPFEILRKNILPQLMTDRAATRELRFWYGASSTGQEPYSMVMMLHEHFPQLATWKVTHYATDINLEVLAKARSGRYSQIEMNRGLPANYLVKYFNKCGVEWELKPEVRRCVQFEQLNLVKQWPQLPSFDIVMLRNVMIYFDVEAKKQILGKIRSHLVPDGYLFLGTAESTLGLDDQFRSSPVDRVSVYRRADAASTLRVAS